MSWDPPRAASRGNRIRRRFLRLGAWGEFYPEAVQRVCHQDLAGQAGIRLPGVTLVEPFDLFIAWRYQQVQPGGVDIGVAGRACTRAAALSLDAHAPIAD